MVGADQIERAERILQIVYKEQSVPSQLAQAEVEQEAFDNWLNHRVGSAMRHYARAYQNSDPRLKGAYNTLLMHFFLVGLVAGRDERVGIE